jgi:hypothetical protein
MNDRSIVTSSAAIGGSDLGIGLVVDPAAELTV